MIQIIQIDHLKILIQIFKIIKIFLFHTVNIYHSDHQNLVVIQTLNVKIIECIHLLIRINRIHINN
jgi:hypothetical protein